MVKVCKNKVGKDKVKVKVKVGEKNVKVKVDKDNVIDIVPD